MPNSSDLGTNSSRFTKRLLCFVDSWSSLHAWYSNATQASEVVTLQAGEEYYLDALVKQAGGTGHLALGWIRPGQSNVEVIPGKMPDGTVVLKSEVPDPLDADDDGLPDTWEIAQGLNPHSRADNAFVDSNGNGFNNLTEYQTGGSALTAGGNTGSCEYHTFFIGANNGRLSALTSSSLFAQTPGASGYYSLPEAPQNSGGNLGRRIRGVITIPATGAYQFYISGSDACSLLINPDGVSRFGKTQVAVSNTATGFRDFTPKTTQKSVVFNFLVGHQIYFEALNVCGANGGHCSVGWSTPVSSTPVVIPSSQISVCQNETRYVEGVAVNNDVDNDSLPDDWEAAHGLAITNTATGSESTDAQQNGEYGDRDGDGLTNFQEYQNNSNPLTAEGVAGKWYHEFYAEIGGGAVRDLLGPAGLLRKPDLVRLSDSTEYFRNYGCNYGQRFRATIKAPASGTYTFWIAADDGAELWLSPNDRKFAKRRIALIDDIKTDYNYCGFREWDKTPGQKSVPITLEKDHSYYIEVLHKQGGWGDHVSVAWSYNSTNWALGINGATATQSSTAYGGEASRAIDGNTDGIWNDCSVTYTSYESMPWLEVNFGTNRPISSLLINNVTDPGSETNLSNFRLSLLDASGNEVAGQDFYQNGDYCPASLTWSVPNGPVTARKARIKLLGSGTLRIAELQALQNTSADSSARDVIPSSVLTSFVRDADDKDDDCLMDSWETAHGLDPNDNGSINPDNGEYGDPDHDMIVNRDEWLLGTDPMNADTDGDGYSDGQEVYFMGTDPLVAQPALPGGSVGHIPLLSTTNPYTSSGTWVPTADGSLFTMDTRGWIQYNITVGTTGDDIGTEGYYMFEICGSARGSSIQSVETFPLDIYIDGKKVASTILTSLNGESGLAAGFAGRLLTGFHTIRVWNRNLLGRRSLQIDSLRVVKATGTDTNADGMPDWIYDFLSLRNSLTPTSGDTSLTSPCCLEGTSRNLEVTTISVDGTNYAPVSKGVNNLWYADVALSSTDATAVTVRFENDLLESSTSITWVPLNLAANTDLTIRKNDSLRLTAFTSGGTAGSSSVVLTLDGQALATTPANQPCEHQFTTAGDHTLTATYVGTSGSQTCTTVIHVLAADFGDPFALYLNRSRLWNLPNVPAYLPVDNDNTLLMAPQKVSGSGRAFMVDATALGANNVLARTSNAGPVIAAGQVNGILLSQSANNETPVIQTLPNGDRIVDLTIYASSLPPGGYIRLVVWLGGRAFIATGTTTQDLYASDFDENGVAHVQMILSSDVGTSCHATYLYDANNNLIGQM